MLVAYVVEPVIGYRAVSFIFLLPVVGMASFLGRGPSLVTAILSALLWDFFFQPPIFSLRIAGIEDQVMLAMYLVVALVLGELTARVRAQGKSERQFGERATTLYQLNLALAEAANLDQIVGAAVQQLQRVFEADVAVMLVDANEKLQPPHIAGNLKLNEEELRGAVAVCEVGRLPGAFSRIRSQAGLAFLPLNGSSMILGVIGLRLRKSQPLSTYQRDLLEAFTQQIALALDRLRIREVLAESKMLAESECLSKTLLNSMSHEMRTPLAVIEAASSNLVEIQKPDLSSAQRSMVAEIREATERLNRLVGNVINMTRLESGHVRPKFDFHDVAGLVHGVMAESQKALSRHQVTVQIEPELPFVWMDLALMHQALLNLMANAAFHTSPGTAVQITARLEEEVVVLAVEDRGPGINPAQISHIFEKFYRAPEAPTGGTGLGLSIVKGFVEAQGGSIKAENRAGGGMVFAIRLPLDKKPAIPDEEDAQFCKPTNSDLLI